MIDVLPDEILLRIFDFYVDEVLIHAWQSLVHVCRLWRSIVFDSPRRLNLRLFYSTQTSARDTLDFWPALPLLRVGDYQTEDADNIVAVLEHSDRVCLIGMFGLTAQLESVLAAMQKPFPELEDLVLESSDGTVPIFPDSFMGGSTPRLQSLWLDRIPFPGLPKLLLSASHLINLHILNTPLTGYISPETIVTALATLTNLETLKLEFQSPQPHPDPTSRRPPSPIRAVLPVFMLLFQGDSKYLEDFVARIDAPQLTSLYIAFVDQIVSDTLQFVQFINRTPALKEFEKAAIVFEDSVASVNFSSQKSVLNVGISCRKLPWQLLSLQRVFTSSLPPLSTSEDLFIYEEIHSKKPDWLHIIDSTLWLELLQPFTAVKNLFLSKTLAPYVVPILQGLALQRTTEVLPILQNISLEKLPPSKNVQKGIKQFVATRQIPGHPIAVSRWDRDRTGFDD